jgi:hypothetical protein
MMTGAISIKSLIAFTALGFLLASTVLSPLHLPRLSFIADFFASKSKPDPPDGLSLIYEGDKPTVE